MLGRVSGLHPKLCQDRYFTYSGLCKLQNGQPGNSSRATRTETMPGWPRSRSAWWVHPWIFNGRTLDSIPVMSHTKGRRLAHPENWSFPRNLILLRLKIWSIWIIAPRKINHDISISKSGGVLCGSVAKSSVVLVAEEFTKFRWESVSLDSVIY